MQKNGPRLIGLERAILQESRPPDRQSYEPLLQRAVKGGVPLHPVYSRQVGPPRKTRSGLQIVVAVLLCVVLVLSFENYMTLREDSQRHSEISEMLGELQTRNLGISSMLADLQTRNTTMRTDITVTTSTTVATSTSLTTKTSIATCTTLTTKTYNTTLTHTTVLGGG